MLNGSPQNGQILTPLCNEPRTRTLEHIGQTTWGARFMRCTRSRPQWQQTDTPIFRMLPQCGHFCTGRGRETNTTNHPIGPRKNAHRIPAKGRFLVRPIAQPIKRFDTKTTNIMTLPNSIFLRSFAFLIVSLFVADRQLRNEITFHEGLPWGVWIGESQQLVKPRHFWGVELNDGDGFTSIICFNSISSMDEGQVESCSPWKIVEIILVGIRSTSWRGLLFLHSATALNLLY